MSGPVDLAEFLPAYLEEAEELLASARRHLLAAESSAQQGAPNPRAVRELFRTLHTVKGLSAMIDVEPVVDISHRMETALRAADRAAGRLEPRAIEPLLQGLQAIELRLGALGAGQPVQPAPLELLDALDALTEGSAIPARAPTLATPLELVLEPSIAAKLTSSEKEQLLQGVRAGRRALRADFAPSPAKSAQGLTINTVRERVAEIAEVVKVVPLSRPASKDAPGGLVFALLVLTGDDDAALAKAVGVEGAALVPLTSTRPPAPATASQVAAEWTDAEELPALRRDVVRVDATRLDEAMEELSALVVGRARLARAVSALTASGVDTREVVRLLAENARQLKALRAAVLRVRMVSVAEVLDRLPLMIRGLSRQTGKPVRLRLEVGDAELDKSVGDRLLPAIVHLVRNAVDHALEPVEERRRLGKPEEGQLRISCHPRSNAQLELSVSDDGRGVDAEAAARRLGVPVPRTQEALLELLCQPGLSTRDQVTTTSGRGMGMDIVRRIAVDQLGGELAMETRPGAGTTFTLRVPLTLAIVDAFVFEVAAQRFAVPVSAVEELVEVDPARIVRGPSPGAGGVVGLIERRGAAVPLLRLDAMLALVDGGAAAKAIVVRQQGQPVAFAVDRMLAQQEIVVRPLEDPLVRVRGVSGATDLGDGRPTLVLDLAALAPGRAGAERRS